MQLSARIRKVPTLFWVEQQQRGFSEDDLQGMTEEEQEEALQELTEEDLEDPPPRPVIANRHGETILLLFSSEERAWAFLQRQHKGGGKYLTGEPRTLDDLQVNHSDDVDELIALCEDVVSSPEAVTGFSLDPPSDFLSKDSADLVRDLTQMRQLIWQKAQQGK